VLSVLLVAGCATVMTARSDFDEQADFSKFRTFHWMSDNPLIMPNGRSPEISSLNLRRIVEAIEDELSRKGFAKASSRESADFVIAFTVGTREKVDIESYPAFYRGPWHWRSHFWDTEFRARTYTEGILAIDVFDQQTRNPVWHGWTSKRVKTADVEDPRSAIRTAVAAILAEFPP
jgi:hypothetical protein